MSIENIPLKIAVVTFTSTISTISTLVLACQTDGNHRLHAGEHRLTLTKTSF